MFNKKSSIGKKAKVGLLNITLFSLVFSFISIIYIFIAVLGYATANDYLFFNLQNITEELEQEGIIKQGTANFTQTFGDDFREFNFHLDDLWLIAYITFIASSFYVSYRADRHNYFSFLMITFYGVMLFLFLLTFFSTVTNWFKDEILLSIVPTLSIIVPKFYFYLDNLGIFSAVHLVLCFLINMLDFDFAKIRQRKKQENASLKDDEIL